MDSSPQNKKSPFNHPHVLPNPFALLSSAENKRFFFFFKNVDNQTVLPTIVWTKNKQKMSKSKCILMFLRKKKSHTGLVWHEDE